MYEMKEEYYIGVEFIDQQHKKLFEIANRAFVLLKNEYIADKFDEIVEVITELKDYTAQHFHDEEEYMLSLGYKKLLSHKVEHDEFIEKINSIDFDNLDRNQTQSLIDILDFLNDWLVHHILERDKMITTLK